VWHSVQDSDGHKVWGAGALFCARGCDARSVDGTVEVDQDAGFCSCRVRVDEDVADGDVTVKDLVDLEEVAVTWGVSSTGEGGRVHTFDCVSQRSEKLCV